MNDDIQNQWEQEEEQRIKRNHKIFFIILGIVFAVEMSIIGTFIGIVWWLF